MNYLTNIMASFYLLTFKVGFCGNLWVIFSIYRSRRPHTGGLTQSERLRAYIVMLAIVDLLVVISSSFRFYYTIQPNIIIDTAKCRIIFIINYFVKLCSITCLVCINIERYITIRKPFNSKVRKRFIKLTPVVALFLLFFVMCAIALISLEVISASGKNMAERICTQLQGSGRYGLADLARLTVSYTFLFKLFIVSISYGQIVRHVRRTFWERKARVVANSVRNTNAASIATLPVALVIAEPRYMRDMTAAIVRIACFHVICWLPYCLFQILPNSIKMSDSTATPLSIYTTTSVRLMTVNSWQDPLAWCGFIADWLTYVNSASDWIFYAAMNRDLRSVIRATSERRKRSNLSQQSPSSNLHNSLRRQMSQSLRLFYSINSYRSNANSLDESVSIIQNGHVGNTQHNNSINDSSKHTQSVNMNNSRKNFTTASLLSGDSTNGSLSPPILINPGLFGMRNGHAHTYCIPKAPSINGSIISGISGGVPLNGCLKSSPGSPIRKQLLWLANDDSTTSRKVKNLTTPSLLSGDSTNGSLSPPIINLGLFGMRNGRAHTYCIPKAPSINESITSSISGGVPLNGCLKGSSGSPTNGDSTTSHKVSINSQVSISSGNKAESYNVPLTAEFLTPPITTTTQLQLNKNQHKNGYSNPISRILMPIQGLHITFNKTTKT